MNNNAQLVGPAKTGSLDLNKDEIKKLVKDHTPKGQDAYVWYRLVQDKMGLDKMGKKRPSEDIIQFIYVCYRTGLDPILGQIHAVYRWSSAFGRETMSIQTGIDGMRLVAQRTKEYAGQEDITYIPEDESTGYPAKASVTIYKMLNGARVSFSASARWNEYVQLDKNKLPTSMWKKMPYLMLGKCAEALALRKAFPNELSGIYSTDEMHQSDNVMSGLPTPERFEKPEAPKEIEVVHGAPEDNQVSTPPVPQAPGKAPEPMLPTPENPKVEEVKDRVPDFGGIRSNLKPNLIVKPAKDEKIKSSPVNDPRVEIH